MLFVIEHLEPRLSEWLYIEYSHAARIVGKNKLIVTNVKRRDELEKLSTTARVERKSVRELFNQEELIVLDPGAKKKLSPRDFNDRKAIVIGGVLGGDPPLGRTWKLLTKKLPRALSRNIGKQQFSIDGAVYVGKEVSEGRLLENVPVQHGVEIQLGEGHSVLLPYAYPLVKGGPLISKKLIVHLKRPWAIGRR